MNEYTKRAASYVAEEILSDGAMAAFQLSELRELSALFQPAVLRLVERLNAAERASVEPRPCAPECCPEALAASPHPGRTSLGRIEPVQTFVPEEPTLEQRVEALERQMRETIEAVRRATTP